MDRLGLAIDLHQRGLWEQAAATYREVLAGDPQSADAWHLLGVLAHQCGDQVQAQWLIGHALELRPGEPAFLANLAEVHRASGELAAAVSCCRAALPEIH